MNISSVLAGLVLVCCVLALADILMCTPSTDPDHNVFDCGAVLHAKLGNPQRWGIDYS